MPYLVSLMIVNFTNGFLIGVAGALLAIWWHPTSTLAMLLTDNGAALGLALVGIGSSFGLVSLATAVWTDGGLD